MIYQKENYNKKIAPFSYDRVTKQNMPVKINVSVAIRNSSLYNEEEKAKFLKNSIQYQIFTFFFMPEMEFLEISLTKDVGLLLADFKENHTILWFS